uniref:exodeoxyribonuclease III n=1 Tax=Astatotilapia calliptera TaxID=8154 RepID=A0AAX7UJD9_ASTCA
MGILRLVTWNINGAGTRGKRLKIFNQLKKLQADVVLLQETHKPVTGLNELKTPEFPNVFAACYNSRQQGVAILIHKNVNFTVLDTVIDPEGRFLILKLSILNKKLCIVSIYGPSVDEPSFFHGFFSALSEHLDCALILGGDLNLGLNEEMDRLNTTGTQRNLAFAMHGAPVTPTLLLEQWRGCPSVGLPWSLVFWGPLDVWSFDLLHTCLIP